MMQDNMKLLRAMGDIDDKYITEVLDEDKNGAAVYEKKAPKGKKKGNVIRFMTYALPAAAAVLIVFVAMRSGQHMGTTMSDATMPASSSGNSCKDADYSMDAASVMQDECEAAADNSDASSYTNGVDAAGPSLSAESQSYTIDTESDGDREGDVAQVANPFIDCKDMTEASVVAGFKFSVPDDLVPGAGRMINAVESDMIQVIYFEGDAYDPDKEILRIRKASGSRDISGDYGEYPYKDSLDISGYEVIVMGYSENEIMTAMWQYDGFTYALLAGSEAVETDTLTEIVNAVTD